MLFQEKEMEMANINGHNRSQVHNVDLKSSCYKNVFVLEEKRYTHLTSA